MYNIYIYWLVVSSPLTNMSSSAGMVTFPKPPTRQIPVLFWACIFAKNMFLRNYSTFETLEHRWASMMSVNNISACMYCCYQDIIFL